MQGFGKLGRGSSCPCTAMDSNTNVTPSLQSSAGTGYLETKLAVGEDLVLST